MTNVTIKLSDSSLVIPLSNLHREISSPLELGESCIFHRRDLPSIMNNAINGLLGPAECYIVKIPGRRDEHSVNTLNRVLAVFKLFKEGIVLSNIVLTELPDDVKVEVFPHYRHWVEEGKSLEPYSLNKTEEQEFAVFWREFIDLPPTDFAVYRFHLADFRPYLADRFVDYVESLECLLVPDSGEGEIRYKLSSRGALIVGLDKAADERKHIYQRLKWAYDLRSALVHGDQYKAGKLRDNIEWAQVLREVREYDRAIIRFFARAKCLDNVEARRQLLEKQLIFEAKTSLDQRGC